MDSKQPLWEKPKWNPSTPAITVAKFDDLLSAHPAVAVHFGAAWNTYDVGMDRDIQKIRPQFQGRVHFVSCDIDADENIEFCKKLEIIHVPTLGIFRRGRDPLFIFDSERDCDRLSEEIEDCFASEPSFKKWWQFWLSKDYVRWIRRPSKAK